MTDLDEVYRVIKRIQEMRTRREVRAYYKSLPRELQDSPLVLVEVRRKYREMLFVRFYRWWFSR